MRDNQIYKLRQVLGILGIILPVVDFIGLLLNQESLTMMSSISKTYYSPSVSIFCGVLFAIGVCLIFYWYDDIQDKVLTTLAGIFAICIAIFPTKLEGVGDWNLFNIPTFISNIIHSGTAIAFFGILSYISIAVFTKTSGEMTEQKRKRNMVYKVCGWVMAGSILLGGALDFFGVPFTLYAGEAIGLWAFGISWLVKGGTFLEDK